MRVLLTGQSEFTLIYDVKYSEKIECELDDDEQYIKIDVWLAFAGQSESDIEDQCIGLFFILLHLFLNLISTNVPKYMIFE